MVRYYAKTQDSFAFPKCVCEKVLYVIIQCELSPFPEFCACFDFSCGFTLQVYMLWKAIWHQFSLPNCLPTYKAVKLAISSPVISNMWKFIAGVSKSTALSPKQTRTKFSNVCREISSAVKTHLLVKVAGGMTDLGLADYVTVCVDSMYSTVLYSDFLKGPTLSWHP